MSGDVGWAFGERPPLDEPTEFDLEEASTLSSNGNAPKAHGPGCASHPGEPRTGCRYCKTAAEDTATPEAIGETDDDEPLEAEIPDAGHEADGTDAAKLGEDGDRKFTAKRFAEGLAAETPVAVGGESLFVYRAGAYRPGGEDDLKQRIAQRLGHEWSRRKESEIVGFLRATAGRLWEAPPRDRINFTNGILDLANGKLGPHDPDFLSPVQIAAAFDPAAECPAIEKFFGEILPPELVELVFELIGYLLTPDNSMQKAFMLLGEGANGKSTALTLITRLLGTENVSAVALHRLDENDFATASLYGKLANVFADLDARALRSSGIFKSITGGDLIEAERKFRPAFKFRPYARQIFSANEPPPTTDSSHAFFRRWITIPFERSFTDEQAEENILDRLTTPSELSGLLNRGLAALAGLRARGAFKRTEQTDAAAKRFQEDSDSAAGFLADRVAVERDARVPKPMMFRAYREWCADNNRQPLSAVRFNRRVTHLVPGQQLGLVVVQGTETWVGIGLRESMT